MRSGVTGDTCTKALLDELRRLVEASEVGDLCVVLDESRVSKGESEAIRLINAGIGGIKKSTEKALTRRDNLIIAGNEAAQLLLTTDEEKYEASMHSAMELLGYGVDADRICIIKNEKIDGEWHFVFQYEWVRDPNTQEAAVSKGLVYPYDLNAEWLYRFRQGEIINGPVQSMAPSLQMFLSRAERKSALLIPLFLQERFWGLASFSDCVYERCFSEDEINILRSGALMMVSAINQHEQAAEIHEAHQRTRILLDSMPYTCHLWNRDQEMFDCNEENIRLFKVRDKTEFRDNFPSFSPEYQPDGRLSCEVVSGVLSTAFAEGHLVFEFMHQASDGTPIPCEITLVRVPYANDYVVAAYARDLREQKRMMEEIERSRAQLEAASSAKSDFLASMSHEMRTPLNAVIGLSELSLAHGTLDEETFDNLEKIYNAGALLLNIVNDILDISKIEAGKLELIPGEYDTPSLINDIVSQNVFRIGEKPIEFVLDISADTPATLYGDDLRIKQILNNLLSNAIKYSKQGAVELGLRTERAEDSDTVWVTAWIRDTGIGIRPEDIQKLFSDYSQVDVKANRKVEGTGLGLAITKKLIELMDGTISVESEYGKGSVFTVRFRQRSVNDSTIGESVVNNLKSFQYSDRKRKKGSRINYLKMQYAKVLVVDDNMTNLDVAKGLMKPYGMQIDCVSSGAAAVHRIAARETLYDAIFMDHMMPEMDGIEATQKIRELGTEYAEKIPVIALTANAVLGNEQMFLENGFQAFLSKPIDIMLLDAVIRQWVRDKDREATQRCDEDHSLLAEAMEGENMTIEIPGVDTETGLDRFGGNTETYISVLQSFVDNTPAIMNRMRKVSAVSLPDYAIDVHGLKSACGSIGADSAMKKAKRQEEWAKADDLGQVLEYNQILLDEVEVLLEDICLWLLDRENRNTKPRLSYPNPVLLSRLRQSCIEFEIDGVDKAMDELESSDYDQDASLIIWLRKKVDALELQEVAEQLAKYDLAS